MDYLASETVDTTGATVMLIGGIVLLLASFVSFGFGVTGKIPVWSVVPIALAMISGVVLLAGGASSPSYAELEAKQARDEKVATVMTERYEVTFSGEDVGQFEYPDSRPESDFEVFGSVKKAVQVEDANFEQRELYLVWANDRFELSQSDNGEDFQALEIQR